MDHWFCNFARTLARNSGISVSIKRDGNYYIAVFSDGTRISHSINDGKSRIYIKKHIEKTFNDCYNSNTGGVDG